MFMGNLDDVASCPRRAACEACGAVDVLAVVTFDLPIGVLCATLCDVCARDEALPPWLRFGGAGRVSRHAGHCQAEHETGANPAPSQFPPALRPYRTVTLAPW